MPGRGPLTFKKRQREMLQKEKQAAKLSRKLERKQQQPDPEEDVAHASQTDLSDSGNPDSE